MSDSTLTDGYEKNNETDKERLTNVDIHVEFDASIL